MPAAAPLPFVDAFVRLALLSAIEDGERTPEGVVHWALDVLPPAVRDAVSRAELVARAAQLLGSDDTEGVVREPRH